MSTNNDFNINSEYTYMKYQLNEMHIKIHTNNYIKHLSNISTNIINVILNTFPQTFINHYIIQIFTNNYQTFPHYRLFTIFFCYFFFIASSKSMSQ